MSKKDTKPSQGSGGVFLVIIIATAILYMFMSGNNQPAAPTQPTTTTAPIIPTSHPKTQALTTAIAALPQIQSVSLVSILIVDNKPHIYIEAITTTNNNTVTTADAIRSLAHQTLVTAALEIDMILDDSDSALVFTWSNETDSWTETVFTK